MTAAAARRKYPNTREGWCPSEKFASVPKASTIPQKHKPNQPMPSSHPPAMRKPDFIPCLIAFVEPGIDDISRFGAPP